MGKSVDCASRSLSTMTWSKPQSAFAFCRPILWRSRAAPRGARVRFPMGGSHGGQRQESSWRKRSTPAMKAMVMFCAVSFTFDMVSARHPNHPATQQIQNLEDHLGSSELDDWCEQNWPQDLWSSYDSYEASITSSTLQSSQSEELSHDWSRKLLWYVNFADFFTNYYGLKDSPVVAEQATALIREALAWEDQAAAGHADVCGPKSRQWNSYLPFRPARYDSRNAAQERPESPEIEFTWIEAPKSKGLALVCIAPSEKLAVVAVRGSVNVRNFVMALKMWPENKSKQEIGVKLHAGFAEVADEIMEKVEPLLDRGMTIHLTGHSLGGAVSTILALRLKKRGYDIAQVVAFGMPLVIWRDGQDDPLSEELEAALNNIPLLRVEHPLDPVPNFPAPARAIGIPVEMSLSRKRSGSYYPVGRRVSIGSRETLPKHSTTPMLAHRLRTYSAQCVLMAHAASAVSTL